MPNTKAEVLAMVRAELDAMIERKREIEAEAVVRDDVFQYASGAVQAGFRILRALERSLLLVALVVLFVAGCGDVSSVQLGPEGGADVEQDARPGVADTIAEAGADHGLPRVQDAGTEAPPSGPSCNVDERCAACAPYPCAAVIACALSGDAGAYPWQSCHNLNADVGDVDGLHCAMRAACP